MVSYPVSSDVTVLVQIQVQNAGLRPMPRNELSTEYPDELLRILDEGFGETVDSKQDCGQTFHSGIVSKHADIGSGSECGHLADELHIVCFNEEHICFHFKSVSNGSKNLPVSLFQEIFLGLKNCLVVNS